MVNISWKTGGNHPFWTNLLLNWATLTHVIMNINKDKNLNQPALVFIQQQQKVQPKVSSGHTSGAVCNPIPFIHSNPKLPFHFQSKLGFDILQSVWIGCYIIESIFCSKLAFLPLHHLWLLTCQVIQLQDWWWSWWWKKRKLKKFWLDYNRLNDLQWSRMILDCLREGSLWHPVIDGFGSGRAPLGTP